MQFVGQLTVVHRRSLVVDQSDAYLLPLLDPIFRIETHMSFEERIELFRLASALPANFVACEIGSYFGSSRAAFLATAATLKAGRVHAIDTWHNDAMLNEVAEDTYAQLRNTRLLRHFISVHRGHAEDVKQDIPMIDLLFIDGDHSYEGAKANLLDYVPKLKPGGILILHDYTLDTVARAAKDALDFATLEPIKLVQSLQSFRVKAATNGHAS